MKIVRALLVISIGANVAFGGWFLVHRSRSTRDGGPDLPTSHALTIVPQTSSREVSQEPPQNSAAWEDLQAGSDTDYVANLRREGFSLDIIHLLVAQRIRDRFKDRLDALRPKHKDEYWRRDGSYSPNADPSPEARAARRAILREINETVRQAIGPEFETMNPSERAQRLRNYGNLPRVKADQITAINVDYHELGAQVRDRAGGVLLKEDRDLLRLLDAEQRADVAVALTPDELLEYDLRSSTSAGNVRGQLTYFNATEEEFRALTAVQLAFDREYGSVYPSKQETERRKEAEKQLAAQMQSVLSPERAAEFQLVTDPVYQGNASFLQGFNYEPALAREMLALQRSITERAAAIRNDPLRSGPIRENELAALHREATEKLGATLSPKALETYQTREVGKWLKELRTNPAAP